VTFGTPPLSNAITFGRGPTAEIKRCGPARTSTEWVEAFLRVPGPRLLDEDPPPPVPAALTADDSGGRAPPFRPGAALTAHSPHAPKRHWRVPPRSDRAWAAERAHRNGRGFIEARAVYGGGKTGPAAVVGFYFFFTRAERRARR